MKKYYIPLLLICCMLFSGCNKNSTATETTQSTSSKEFNDNVNKNCTYIAYRGKVIILDNKNNKAKLTNLTDVESSDKVINYSYENMCNLIDQLTVEKIHISGPNNVLYGISYAYNSTDKDSQKNENKTCRIVLTALTVSAAAAVSTFSDGGLGGILLILCWRFAFGRKSFLRYSIRVGLVLLLLISFGGSSVFASYHILRVNGEAKTKQNISTEKNRMQSRGDEGSQKVDGDGLISYNGKKYKYNEDIVTVLVMGIDQRSEVIEQREGVSGESGQADTIFLLVMDETKNRMKVIGISRDTMTPIKMFDYKGEYLGKEVSHLGLAYAFGDGKHTSCQYMVDAVSNLFYGLPIHAYAAFNMESIVRINDAVGGVPVTVPEDLTKVDPELSKGAKVLLRGRQALLFAKWRNTSVDHSNNLRMARQKQYLVSFMKQAISAVRSDVTLPLTLYQDLSEEMVTDIGADQAVYMTTKALTMSLDEKAIVMLKGEPVKGNVYDEIYVDDDALYDLIIQTFYVEIKDEGDEK